MGEGGVVGRVVVCRSLLKLVKVDTVGSVDECTTSCGCKVSCAGIDQDGFEPDRTGERNGDGELIIDVGLSARVGRETLMPWFDDVFGGFGWVEIGTPYFVTDDVFKETGSVSVDSGETRGRAGRIAVVLVVVGGVTAHDEVEVKGAPATAHINRVVVEWKVRS